ncbi:peroxiredoxin (plasmid) [Streptomyces sp. BI20]|uniref:peroxiredoxin n=1 Tax=Streptomyces sp. BI20 TaxID=3403460 RepID=UPI003C727F9B
MAASPGIGDPVDDFSLPGGTWDGDTFHRAEFRLSDRRGAPLVLAYYPGDATPVCTAQLCSYNDGLADLTRAGGAVWGISPQGLDSHADFARARDLRMPLLADTDRVVAKGLGITAPLIGVRRSVFIVDAEGRLAWRHVTAVGLTYPKPEVIAARLAALAEA